jgi:hypothetical protein
VDLLYRSFDGELTPDQQELLIKALQESQELQRIQQRLSTIRRVVTENGNGHFEPFFVTRVMHRINTVQNMPDRASEFFESLSYVFRRVALIGGIAVIVLFSVQLFQKDSEINLASETVSEMTLDDVLGSAFSTTLEEAL